MNKGKHIVNKLFGKAFFRIRATIENNTLLAKVLVKIRAKIEKNPILAGLWLGSGQK